NPEYRVLISLTYVERVSGVNSTVNNGFIYANGTWEKSIGISQDEYSSMGEPRAQFSSENEALVKLPIFLKNKFQYEQPSAGQIEGVMYKLYVDDVDDVDGDGSTNDRTVYSYVVFYIYDGINWLEYNNKIEQSIQFSHDGNTWVPDNTIKYELVDADYTLIADTYRGVAGYDSAVTNLESYGNINTFNWNETMFDAAINTVLDERYPSMEEDQKFSVTVYVYDGSSHNITVNYILTNGTYVRN
ncbi:MAG: hypothetical protein ACPGUU_10000, partial [Flavobacteriaceae bacterium]